MAILHQVLGVASVLFILESSFLVSGKASSPEASLNRSPREVNAPAPIDCELTSWGKWSECDPCTSQRYRSRSIVKFGQYGGKRCLASVGDTQRCKSDKSCDVKPEECEPGSFLCDSGRCIKNRLVCNADNDCGDYSDEICDDQDPKPTCRNQHADLELSEISRTAGNGLNILGMDTRSNPFDNEYFNGICDRVRDGNKGVYYRKSWNTAAVVYQTKADKSVTTETFHDYVELVSKIVQETSHSFEASLSLKWTPTEINDTTVKGSIGVNTNKTARLEKIKEFSTDSNKIFIRVSGNLQLGTFQMRSRGAMLSKTFLDDISFLPTNYDKGEYFAFLETYGTHYTVSGTVGGKYELVYVLDNQKLKSKDVTTTEAQDCLGFKLELNIKHQDIEVDPKLKSEKCKKIIGNEQGGRNKSDVIDKIVSFVEGGTVAYAAQLDEKLAKKVEVDTEDFVKWATSLSEAPVLIKQKPTAIYTLIPVDVTDAHTKRQNLERAIEDYLNEFSVCKCQPCQNGGTVLLVDGECLCKCSIYFEGIACQTAKSTTYETKSEGIDGQWSCWSPSSSCVNEEQTLNRQCNNPAPASGGKPCPGESVKQVPC
ncbi:complement component C9 [Discoglossus pictus]